MGRTWVWKRWQSVSPKMCLILMTISSIIVKYIFVKIIKSTYRCQLYLLFNIEESTQSSAHIHSCWTREKKKNRTAMLRFHLRRKKNVFWIILLKREEIFWQQSFTLCITIIISWRQDHSLERPALKHSWLASKACTSARRRRWEQRQWKEQYRTFLTNLHKKKKIFRLQGYKENSSVPFFQSSWPPIQLLEKPDSSGTWCHKRILNIARLTSRWR